MCLAARFVGSWQCAAVFSLQIPKSGTDLDLTLLYILLSGHIPNSYRKIKRYRSAFASRSPVRVCRVKIMFELLPNNWFVSRKTNAMKYFVNWIPLNMHVCLNKTQPCLNVEQNKFCWLHVVLLATTYPIRVYSEIPMTHIACGQRNVDRSHSLVVIYHNNS